MKEAITNRTIGQGTQVCRAAPALPACVLACLAGLISDALAQKPPAVTLISPAPGGEIVARKPEIRVAIQAAYVPESVRVLLDGVDVTNLIEPAGEGFSYTPPQVLPGGAHVLIVHARTAEGMQLARELEFSTRHTESFTELSSAVQLAIEGEWLADRHESPQPEPTYRSHAEIVYGLRAAEGRWDTRLNTNLWFQNQKLPVFPPVREGLNLASLTLSTMNRGQRHAFSAAVGDVQIAGTKHSLASLARRGALLGFDYRDFSLGGFAVNSRQVFGFTGGTGIGTDDDRNIYGFTTGFGFLGGKLRFDAIHARGGEPGSSFGLFTAQGATRGRVTGAVLRAQPWSSLSLEAEYDESAFDPDAADGLAGREDQAYGLRLSGQKGVFNYQLAYEHLGPDYAVIASPVLTDQESIAVSGGFAFSRHSLSVTALHQHDNVDGDPARSRLANDEASFDYGFMASERWSLGVGYRDSRVESSREPAGFAPQEVSTGGATARIQYTRQPWLVSFAVQRSDQDDAFFDGNDSKVLTRTFSSSYQTPHFSIVPMFSVNTTTMGETGVDLEQRNLSLMLNGKAARERFGYGLAFAYYDQRSSDGAFDSSTNSAELRVSWQFRRSQNDPPRGALNLRATWMEAADRIAGFETEDWAVWLTVSFNPQFTL